MLNLIICIMGDTYETVIKNEVSASMIELASLVLECEMFWFRNRKRTETKYFLVCTEVKKEEDESDLILSKLGKISESVKELSLNVATDKRLMEKKINRILEILE